MKLSEFVDVFTAILYNESSLSNKRQWTIGEIVQKYSLDGNARWWNDIFEDYDFSTRIASRRHLGPTKDQRVSLTTAGVRWVEDELGENVVTFLEQHGVGTPTAEPTIEQRVRSADWTGIAAKITGDRLHEIKRHSADLLAAIDQSEADEKTRKNARAHVSAVIQLLEAPDPPWKAIVELLNHPGVTAILTALNIIQLIFG